MLRYRESHFQVGKKRLVFVILMSFYKPSIILQECSILHIDGVQWKPFGRYKMYTGGGGDNGHVAYSPLEDRRYCKGQVI